MTQQGEGVPAHGRGGVVRWIIDVVAGFALLGLGLLLVLVLFPELGVPLTLVGLGLLARHLAWAQRAHERVHRWEHEVEHWWQRLPRATRLAISAAVLAVIGLLLWWWLG